MAPEESLITEIRNMFHVPHSLQGMDKKNDDEANGRYLEDQKENDNAIFPCIFKERPNKNDNKSSTV